MVVFAKKNINLLFYFIAFFLFLLISSQVKAAECILNDVNFFNLDSNQIEAIQKAGGKCETTNQTIDIVIDRCVTNNWLNPSFRATVINNSEYNFDNFYIYFDIYDTQGYGMDNSGVFGGGTGLRPGQKKTDEMELFWEDDQSCYDIGSLEITNFELSLWNDDSWSLPLELQQKIFSIINVKFLDDSISLNSSLEINLN